MYFGLLGYQVFAEAWERLDGSYLYQHATDKLIEVEQREERLAPGYLHTVCGIVACLADIVESPDQVVAVDIVGELLIGHQLK